MITLKHRVKQFASACNYRVDVDDMNPGILSDIGTEGVSLDHDAVYICKQETTDLDVFKRTIHITKYHVWTEVSIPGTRESPPDSDVVELITTARLDEAIEKAFHTIMRDRMDHYCEMLAEYCEMLAEQERSED